ncbi:hypothetical protein N9137_00945 [Pseudomonadales bacterium]|nr:hypothetical protein [Pseudomonadales bacterium]
MNTHQMIGKFYWTIIDRRPKMAIAYDTGIPHHVCVAHGNGCIMKSIDELYKTEELAQQAIISQINEELDILNQADTEAADNYHALLEDIDDKRSQLMIELKELQ